MMPPLLEALLTFVAIYATLFFLAWLLARQRLPRRVRVFGWLSVAVTVIGFVWSFLVETLLPYLRRGPAGLMLVGLSLLQVIAALVGVGALLRGAARFLRAWWGMGWWLGSIRTFLEESPAFAAIRREPDARVRWKMAWALIRRVLLLPGLGEMAVGFGVIVLAFQVLEPDRWFQPDPGVMTLGGVAVFLGLAQGLWRRAAA